MLRTADGSTASATGKDRHGCRTIAYVSDRMPTRGPERLLDQLRTIVGAGMPIEAIVADSGSATRADGRGAGLQSLIERRASSSGVLAIAGLRYLARDRRGITLALADLHAAGFVIRDASGEARPSARTMAPVHRGVSAPKPALLQRAAKVGCHAVSGGR